jgi:hypothetical protein
MTRAETENAVLLLDMHGIRVRIEAPGRLTASLMYDYGMFALPDGASPAPVDLRVAVVEQDAGSDQPGSFAGVRGDTIRLAAGAVEVRGPQVTTRPAYLKEIRPYITASVIDLLRQRGGTNVHASAVRARDGAVVFAGEKMAGKTSLVLAMVAAGYAYLSNDITLLLPGADGAVDVGGWPQALPMAVGTQQWFSAHVPEFGIEAPVGVPDGTTPGELFSLGVDGKQRLGWEQICARDGLLRVPLRHLVFPESALDLDKPRVRRLDADEAATRLLQNVDFLLKWNQRPRTPFAELADTTARLVEHALGGAGAIQLQWCADHRLNADAVAEHVGPPMRIGQPDAG